jgi:tetratricopeptide (TPR) repeat protein
MKDYFKENGANSALNVIENLISYEPDLAFIVTLSRGKEKLHSDLNRITRTGHWAKISLLEKEDALGLIVEPAREQLTYLPEAVDAVFALTAGHPYYTQLLCYEIFNELQAEGRHQVEISDVRKAANEALETGRGGFGWLWEGLAPAQKIVASLLAEAAEDSRNHFISEAQLSTAFENNHIHRRGLELVEAPNQLIDLDIIERKGPGIYHYLVELVRCWVHEKHPISREREENLALLSDRAASEFSKGQSAGSPDRAIHHFREAIVVNPNHIAAQLALATILLEQGKISEAVDAYEAAYWLDEAKAKEGLNEAKTRLALDHPKGRGSRWFWKGNIILIIIVIAFTSLSVWQGLFTQNDRAPTSTQVMTTVKDTPLPTKVSNSASTQESTQVPKPEPSPQPTEEPTKEATQTAAFKHSAPLFVSPETKTVTTQNEDVVLEWESASNLADNEQYMLRLRFTREVSQN